MTTQQAGVLDGIKANARTAVEKGDLHEGSRLLVRLAKTAESFGSVPDETVNALGALAGLYMSMGELDEAEVKYRMAVDVANEALGAAADDTCKARKRLVACLDARKKRHEASLVLVENHAALALQRGEADPGVLAAAGAAIRALCNVEKLADAEALAQASLAACERHQGMGPRDLATAECVVRLANVLSLSGGRVPSVMSLLTRAVSIREERLGPNHPDTATVIYMLGCVHLDGHRPRSAAPLLERALAAREQEFGDKHELTLRTMQRLGVALAQMDEASMAEALLRRVLLAYKEDHHHHRHVQHLDSDSKHPHHGHGHHDRVSEHDRAMVWAALGQLRFRAGRWTAAKVALKRACALDDAHMAKQKNSTLFHDKGETRHEMGRQLEHISGLRDGSGGRAMLELDDALTTLMHANGELELAQTTLTHSHARELRLRAAAMAQHSYDLRVKNLGEHDRLVLEARETQTKALFDAEQHEEARAILPDVVTKLVAESHKHADEHAGEPRPWCAFGVSCAGLMHGSLAHSHPQVMPVAQRLATALHRLGTSCIAVGRQQGDKALVEDGVRHLRHALSQQQAAVGAHHMDVLATTTQLANGHRDSGDAKLAEKLYARALAGLPAEHREVGWVLCDLGECYAGAERYDEAEECFDRALEFAAVREGLAGDDGHMLVVKRLAQRLVEIEEWRDGFQNLRIARRRRKGSSRHRR